jgi:hypothetical protein
MNILLWVGRLHRLCYSRALLKAGHSVTVYDPLVTVIGAVPEAHFVEADFPIVTHLPKH